MKHYIIFSLIFLLFQGCAQLGSSRLEADRLETLNNYVNKQEFGQALRLLSETPVDHPQAVELEKKRKQVLNAQRAYEIESISLARKQERAGEWSAARLSYKRALEKSGPSQKLELAEQALLEWFQVKKNGLELEELIVTGELLHKKLPLLQQLHDLDPDDPAIQQRYSRARNETKEVAQHLLEYGKSMLEEKKFTMAGRILPLVVKLAPDLEAKTALKHLNTRLKAGTQKKQKNKKEISRKKDKKRIEAYNKAMTQGDFSGARRQLSLLTPTMRESMAAKLMQERLDRDISTYVQKELAVGDSFYRSGQYEQAIKVWQAIQELEQGNEAVKSKIERAQVIVEKVNSLRRRQGGEAAIRSTEE